MLGNEMTIDELKIKFHIWVDCFPDIREALFLNICIAVDASLRGGYAG